MPRSKINHKDIRTAIKSNCVPAGPVSDFEAFLPSPLLAGREFRRQKMISAADKA